MKTEKELLAELAAIKAWQGGMEPTQTERMATNHHIAELIELRWTAEEEARAELEERHALYLESTR